MTETKAQKKAREKAEQAAAAKAEADKAKLAGTDAEGTEEPTVETEPAAETAPEVVLPSVALLDDESVEAIGAPAITLDETKESILVSFLDKPNPILAKQGHPLGGRYVSVFVQPLSDGSSLINYRGAEAWEATGPDACSKDKGGVICTSGHSYRDPQSGRMRNAGTGGLALNKNGFKLFFNTHAAKDAMEAVGIPYDDGSATSLKAQFKGGTLIDRLHREDKALRQKRQADRRQERSGGGAADRPATRRSDAVTTSGPAGEQNLGEADDDFDEPAK